MIKIKLNEALNEKFTEEDLLRTIQSDNSEKKFILALQLILITDKAEFGLQLIKGLDLSSLVDENFIEELIINSSISQLSSPLNFLKLIYLVSQANPKMAIQKHLSTYTAQNKQENTESFNIGKIMHIIETFALSYHKIPPDQIVELSKIIIIEMSKIPLPREPGELLTAKADIQKISEFFLKLTIPYEDRMRFLEIIYTLLSCPTNEPSQLLALGLLVIPNPMIQPALEHFFSTSVQWNAKKTKESIIVTMGRLIYWLRTSNMPVPLDLWIIKTMLVLNNTGMQEIVDEVAKKNISPAFLSLLVPIFQSKTFPVVQALLEHSRNTKELMNQLAPRIVNMLKQLENTKSEILDTLMELICDALGLIDHTEPQYKEIINFLEQRNRTPAKVIVKKKFNGPANYEYLSNNARVGLLNLGNTCYLNSILQALFMTKQFCREVLTTQRNDNAIRELQKLFALMLCSPRPEQNPRTVVNLIRPDDFIAGIQHDSSEFLCSLLDRLHEQEKKRFKDEEDWDDEPNTNTMMKNDVSDAAANVPTESSIQEPVPMDIEEVNNEEGSNEATNDERKEPVDKIVDNTTNNLSLTYVQKIFGGKMCTRYLCKTCNSNSINVDLFRDLQLSFPERSQDENTDMQYNVQQLLEYYFSTEELNLIGNNQYHCDNCKHLRNGMRCTEILEPPKNLILTLKHFRYDSRHHTRSKLLYKVFHDEHISVTVRGSLETNCTRNVDYRLYAAVIHCGNSLDNGHYYTIARESDSNWFKFNDSFVTKSSLDELRGLLSPNTPYILFYQRLSTATSSTTTAVHSESTSVSSSQNADTFPEYQELSMFLRDYINDDKVKYENDAALRKNMTYEKLHPTIRNNFDDNNDPGTGSSYNFDQSYAQNRFIY